MECFSLGELALVRERDEELFTWCPGCEAAWGTLPASGHDERYSTLELVSGGSWRVASEEELQALGAVFDRETDDWALEALSRAT